VELCARSIKPLERGRPWLRRTRALWRLNGRRQRCGRRPGLCGRARQKTPVADGREGVARRILHNEHYCGTAVWNRTRKVRGPGTGRRVQRLRPRAEWTVVESPHLRIISDQVWQAAKNRLAAVNAAFSSGQATGLCSRSYTARYLFSGFLKCGLCGSNLVLIAGRGGVGSAKYGCPLHQNRGTCVNALVVRRDRIEQELISGL
jgi:site-specific DNA recombinase